MIRAVVFDCDGVLRHWEDQNRRVAEVEAACGLAPGTVLAMAFGPELGPLAVTGALAYDEWLGAMRERVGDVAAPAVDAFAEGIGTVDSAVLAVVRDLRAAGTTTAVLSNATTRFEDDLACLGLDEELDRVFNTARLGVAKPDPAVFERVAADLGLAPADVVFVDDLDVNVEGAERAGMTAIRFSGAEDLRARLVALRVLRG